MLKPNRFKHLATVLASLPLLLVAAPAYAQHGADDDAADNGTVTVSGTTQTATETEQDASSQSGSGSGRQQIRPRSEDRLAVNEDSHGTTQQDRQQAKEDKKEVADAKKQKRCETHKQGLDTRSSSIVNNAQRSQERVTAVFDKAVAYQQANNVTAANWNDLIAAANTAKADSVAAIANLSVTKPTIDCASTSVASDVAVFKTAAATTRDKLKAYRTAVKAVVQALIDTKQTAEDTTGDQQ